MDTKLIAADTNPEVVGGDIAVLRVWHARERR